MSNGISADTVTGRIIITVVTALLVGGTSPWWIDYVTGGKSNHELPSPPDTTKRPPEVPNPERDLSGCVVTLQPPVPEFKSEPTMQASNLGQLDAKSYEATDYKVTVFAGKEIGWFQIQSEGTTGWVRNGMLISNTSPECQSFIESHAQ